MKRISSLVYIGFIILISACTSKPVTINNPTPHQTNTPVSTNTPEPLILADFSGQLEGVGEHGGMVCIVYTGESKDLSGLSITANIKKDKRIIDRNLILESIGEKNCFDLVDSNYTEINSTTGSLLLDTTHLQVELNIEDKTREVINNSQILDVGEFKQYPFLGWIFPIELGIHYYGSFRPGNIDLGFHPAIDFTPYNNDEYKQLGKIPVYSPVSGKIIHVNIDPDEPGWQKVNNIIIKHPYTGYYITLGHLNLLTPDGKKISTLLNSKVFHGEHIAFMQDPFDDWSGMVHIHMALTHPSGKGIWTQGDLNNFSFINLFLDNEIQELSKNSISTDP